MIRIEEIYTEKLVRNTAGTIARVDDLSSDQHHGNNQRNSFHLATSNRNLALVEGRPPGGQARKKLRRGGNLRRSKRK